MLERTGSLTVMLLICLLASYISKMSLVLLGLLICLNIPDIAADDLCVGLTCYNGGTKSYNGTVCKCLCSDGFMGLLCETEIKPSKWPDGPYWLVMPKDGCPETREHGWEKAYIEFSANVTGSNDIDFLTYRSRQRTNITGMFGPEIYKINFCYKSVRHENISSWPNWNFAVFGLRNNCPSEMSEHVLSLNMYSITNFISDGPLPDVTISTQEQQSEMKLIICVHERISANVGNISMFGKNPFILVQHPNISLSEIDGITVTDTWFPLPSRSQLDLSYYVPNQRESGPLNITEIDNECHAVFERTVQVNNMENCDTSIYQQSLREDCFDTSWIRIDLMQTIFVGGVVIYSDLGGNFSLFENLLKEASVDIFIGDVRWDNTRKFAQHCSHSNLFVNKIFATSKTGVVVYKCLRSYEGRFITIKVDRHTPSADLSVLMSDKFRIYAISCQHYAATNVPLLPCNSDLGMSSFVIEDFQLSASSTFDIYVPSNARPGLTGWQGLQLDKLSYIQVDLLVVTVINGLEVYNWYEQDENSSTQLLIGATAFRIEYGISLHNMIFYGKKEVEFVIDKQSFDKPQQFIFSNHFLARFVRIYPRPFQDKRPSLKFEILGCRNFGFPSLSCKDSSTSIFVNTSKMYIPYSAALEFNTNQSTTCDDECNIQGDKCTGIVGVHEEGGSSVCQLVLRNYSSRYTMLDTGNMPNENQTIEYTTMKICRDRVFRIQYTALKIDETIYRTGPVNELYLPSSASAYISTPQTLTSLAYPFHYHTNYFRKWSINLAKGFIGLLFTDIYLKENTTNILDKHAGNIYCYEGLFLHYRNFEKSSMFDGQIKDLYNRQIWFTIDSTFNRKKSYIGTEVSRMEMVFRACPIEHYEQNNARGFRVHVQSKGIRPCMTKSYNNGQCYYDKMELISSSYNDIDHARKDEWEIQLGSTYKFLRISLEEFSISCDSGNHDNSLFLINGVYYCNLALSTLPIIIRIRDKVKIELELKPGCVYRYIEGFSLKYDFGIIPFSNQFELLRKMESRELSHRLREACFDEFKKCYLCRRNYANEFSWNDVFSLCKARNMSLLTLMSKREMNFIKGYVAIENPYKTIDVFIGLYRHLDAEDNSYEQWLDGRPLTFTDWNEHPNFLIKDKPCTVMSFSELNTTSWKRVSCNYAYSPVAFVCERPYTGGDHEEILENADDYDVTIIESNNKSTGLIYITASCMCKSENMAVTWFYYSEDNETLIVRQKTQPGYFEHLKPCNRKCNNTHAYLISTGFYLKEKRDGIPVQLQANITNGFNPAGMKNVYTSMLYKLTDPRQKVKKMNNSTLWYCGNGEYISFLARCNGYPECSNQVDETDCDSTCNDNQYRCADGRCIHVSQICDSSNDCLDYSDEYCDLSSDLSISNTLCPIPEQFKCADDGRCLSEDMKCDGYKHCFDGSDENNCDICSITKAYKCSDNTCIPKVQHCDKYFDCNHGTDEEVCSNQRQKSIFRFRTCDDIWAIGHTESGLYEIGSNEVRCEFGKNYTRMVVLHPDWGCASFDVRYYVRYKVEPDNRIKGAVEKGYTCTLKVSQVKNRVLQKADAADGALNSSTYSAVYDQMEFKMSENSVKYIGPDGYYFDYTTFYFMATSLKDPSLSDFYKYPFQMDPVECIKDTVRPVPKLFCDTFVEPVSQENDCIYNTDYKGKTTACQSMEHLQKCELFVCSPGYFKCPRSYCIPQRLVCDGITHCTGNEDEAGCQWCNSTTGTLLIAAMDDRQRLGTDKYFYSSFRVAKQLNSKLILFEKTTRRDTQEYNVHIFETLFTKITIRCILKAIDKRSRTCMDDILLKLNATRKALIWIRSPLPSAEEMIFPSALKSIDRLWTIIINQSEQYPLKIQKESTTEIRLRNMAMLRTVLPDVFADYCNVSRSICAEKFRCSFSRVCLNWQQLCDGIYDCPHRDDEQFCDFVCPLNCTCQGYSVSCQKTNYNTLSVLPFSIRKANISYSIYEQNNLDLKRNLPYLSLLFATNCKIKVLGKGTLQGSKNLRLLDVSYNLITIIQTGALVHLKKLTVLKLKGNRYLSILEPDCFNGIKVSSLEIRKTKIRMLDANVFSGLNLKILDISDNNIEVIKEYAFANLSVDLLRMERNPVSTFNSDLFAGIKSIKLIKASAFKICCVRPVEFPEENCLPHKDEFSSCEDLMRNTTLQALLWTIGLLSLFGNILSMLYRIIFDRKRLKLGYGIFVTNLAIADFLMGVYLLIIAVADKIFRNRYIEVDEYWRESLWCNMAGLLSTISSEMSVMLICCITVDRILVIKFPFGHFKFTPLSALITVVVCWLLSCILAILPLCGFDYFGTSFYGRSPVCLALPLTRERTPGWQYSVFLFIGLNFILFLLIALGQLLIYVEIKKTTKVKRLMNVARSNDLAVARNLLLLVLTDFLCWFPIGCMGIMALKGNYVPIDVYAWTAILILPINSAMNPFLYTFSTIFGKKKFNPDVEEQSRITLSKEIATAALAVLPYFVMEGGRGRFSVISLRERLQEKEMSHRDKFVVVYQMARCLQCLHCNEMVLEKIHADTILLRLSSSNNSVSMIHLQVPQICKSKTEYAENIYQLGCLVEQLFF